MLKANLIANFVGQAWTALLGIAVVPLYVRYLGIEAYGLIGLFAVLQAWLRLLDMGISPTLGREMARFSAGAHTPQSIRDLVRSLEVIVYSLAVFIIFVVWLGADPIARHWLKVEKMPFSVVTSALSITALVIGLRFCEGIYRSAILGLQRQVWFNVTNALLQSLRHLGAVGVLATISSTIAAFFYWQAALSLITVATFATKLRLLLPKSPRLARFSRRALASIWRFAGGLVGINILSTLLTQVDKLLLSRLLTLSEYGYYTLASLVTSAIYMAVAPIGQAIYPRLVELHTQENHDGLARLFHLGAQLVAVMTAPVAVIVATFPEAVLYLWSGDPRLATQTAPILRPLMIGTFLNGMMWMPYQAQLAYGWTSLAVKVNIVAVVLLVPSIVLLVPMYGGIGAGWIWVVLNGGYVMISAHLMHRRILPKEKWRWYGNDVLLPTLGAASVGLAGFSLFPALAFHPSRPLLAAGLAALGIACAAATLSLSSNLRREILSRWRQRR